MKEKRWIFKPFQIRWKEAFGDKRNPYLYRWTIIIFNYSIRIHHWIRSDDKRYYHDHASNFLSIVLNGWYTNIKYNPEFKKTSLSVVKAGSIWFSFAKTRHYLQIPKGGAWTLLLCGRPYHKWGFWITDTKMLRPWKYYKKYGETPYDIQ